MPGFARFVFLLSAAVAFADDSNSACSWQNLQKLNVDPCHRFYAYGVTRDCKPFFTENIGPTSPIWRHFVDGKCLADDVGISRQMDDENAMAVIRRTSKFMYLGTSFPLQFPKDHKEILSAEEIHNTESPLPKEGYIDDPYFVNLLDYNSSGVYEKFPVISPSPMGISHLYHDFYEDIEFATEYRIRPSQKGMDVHVAKNGTMITILGDRSLDIVGISGGLIYVLDRDTGEHLIGRRENLGEFVCVMDMGEKRLAMRMLYGQDYEKAEKAASGTMRPCDRDEIKEEIKTEPKKKKPHEPKSESLPLPQWKRIEMTYDRDAQYGHVSDLFSHWAAVNIALIVIFVVMLVAGTIFLVFGDFKFRDDTANFVHNPSILIYALELRKYEKLLDTELYRNVIDRIRVQGYYQPYSFGRIVRDYTLTMRSVDQSRNLSKSLHETTLDGIEGRRQVANASAKLRSESKSGMTGVRHRKAGKTLFQLSKMGQDEQAVKKKEGDTFFTRLLEVATAPQNVVPKPPPPIDAEQEKEQDAEQVNWNRLDVEKLSENATWMRNQT